MALKGKVPQEVKASRPKFLISGKSGVGKTMFALDFPSVYYVDVEGGAVRKQYTEKLVKSGGAYFGKDEGSQDFNTVISEIKQLATTKHEYKTLVIDSFSKLYNIAAAKAEAIGGSDFGKDKKEANKPTRQLMMWLENLDMTVILICHSKDKWIRSGKEVVHDGTTFDGYDKLEYDLDLWVEIYKLGKARSFLIKKSRVSTFEEGTTHALSYAEFAVLYGKDTIEKATEPVSMASAEQVKELEQLIDVVKVDEETILKWKSKASVDTFAEMKSDDIGKCITFLKSKLDNLTGKGK